MHADIIQENNPSRDIDSRDNNGNNADQDLVCLQTLSGQHSH